MLFSHLWDSVLFVQSGHTIDVFDVIPSTEKGGACSLFASFVVARPVKKQDSYKGKRDSNVGRRRQVEDNGRNRFDKEISRISPILALQGWGFRQIVRISSEILNCLYRWKFFLKKSAQPS